MEQTFIVIPAFNEEAIIAKVIYDVKKDGFRQIIVVDDGSLDRTYAKAKKQKVIVLHHILNRGKGAAVKTGIEAAKMLGATRVVTFDGDGQHFPGDIKKIIREFDKGFSVVLGTRRFTKVPVLKRLANWFANLSTFVIYGMWVKDSQCGLRGFSKKALQCIDTQNDRYEYDSEVVREIGRNHLKFKELPIRVSYSRYSQQKAFRQGFYNGLKTLYRMVISS